MNRRRFLREESTASAIMASLSLAMSEPPEFPEVENTMHVGDRFRTSKITCHKPAKILRERYAEITRARRRARRCISFSSVICVCDIMMMPSYLTNRSKRAQSKVEVETAAAVRDAKEELQAVIL